MQHNRIPHVWTLVSLSVLIVTAASSQLTQNVKHPFDCTGATRNECLGF